MPQWIKLSHHASEATIDQFSRSQCATVDNSGRLFVLDGACVAAPTLLNRLDDFLGGLKVVMAIDLSKDNMLTVEPGS